MIYNQTSLQLYEIIEDYQLAEDPDQQKAIFDHFCDRLWNCDNPRKKKKATISYQIPAALLNTEIGKIFESWSVIEYLTYKKKTKNVEPHCLIRQKINNLYSLLFDPDICLHKEYLELLKVPKKLFFNWLSGTIYEEAALTAEIDQAIDAAITFKTIHARQKMSLPWDDYTKLIESYLLRIFHNYKSLDQYLLTHTIESKHDFWNEESICISYICKSLDGYLKNYKNQYYGVKQRDPKGRCISCGALYKKQNNRQKYCSDCAKKIKVLQNKRYREEKRKSSTLLS